MHCPNDTVDAARFLCANILKFTCPFYCEACQGPVLNLFRYFGVEPKTARKVKHQHTYGSFLAVLHMFSKMQI